MRKPKILECNKSPLHNVFIVEKNKNVLKSIRDFLHSLDFKSHETIKLLYLLGDSDDNYSKKEYSAELYEDRYFNFSKKSIKIEVFFGNKKVALSIFTNKNIQNKLLNNFCHFFSWFPE
ncbi:MAG: hypothetical protein OQK82_08260 [Candidatus Pacearchaeota archaeon]|nr:hypothetical protein [Candidatus Pacearchaeota archaeon]